MAESQPESHYFWYVRATAHLRIGAQSKYLSDCDEILRRFTPIGHPVIAERTAKLLLLQPADADHVDTGIRLARQASADGKDPRYRHWVELVEGIAAYRIGNFDTAVTMLSNLEEQDRRGQPFLAMSGLLLAMAQHENGKPTAAIETLQRATSRIENLHRSSEGWLDWLMCEIVRSEAERLLQN